MSVEAALTSLSLGLLASASPCVLPLYPGFLAYLSARQPGRSGWMLGFFVLAGVLSMMLALGALLALLSLSIGRALALLIPLANLALLAAGVLLLAGINPFKRLPQVQAPLMAHPFANAFLYGLLYGPIALPCAGPLVVGIFAYSLTVGEAAGRLGVFLWFGLGFGLPLLLLSFLATPLQRSLTRLMAGHARAIDLAGGLLLIGVALYNLAVNWEMIRSFL